jgi:hypothetical protein
MKSSLAGHLMKMSLIEMFPHLGPKNQIEGKLYLKPRNPLKKGQLMTLRIQSEKYQNLAVMSLLK